MEDGNSQGFVTLAKIILTEAGDIHSLFGGEMDTLGHLAWEETGLGGLVG